MTAWEIAASILMPLLGILSGLLGVKWRKGMKLLKEGSEAVVALGLCGLSMQKALEDPNVTLEEKNELVGSVKRVGSEFSEAIAAATELFNRSN
jgi:hypothetical protein